MKKSRVDSKTRSSETTRNKDYRFFVLAAVFLVLSLLFSVFLAITVIKGPSGEY